MATTNSRGIRKVNVPPIETDLSISNYNSRYYSHYRTHALQNLNEDHSVENIEKTRNELLSLYDNYDPFDETPVIDSIPNEARELFAQNKIKINNQVHQVIINEVFDDILSDENVVLREKMSKVSFDKKDILSQTKYLELVLSSLEDKMISHIVGSFTHRKSKKIEPEANEMIETTIELIQRDLKKNFEGDYSNVHKSINRHLAFLTKNASKFDSFEQYIEPLITRTNNYIKNNIGKNHIEKVIFNTRKELSKFDINNPDANLLIGIAAYTDQISNFHAVLDNKNVKISTNFFNVRNNLFENSFIFVYGWAMEKLTHIRMEDSTISKESEAKFVEPGEWDRITHFHAIARLYFHEKSNGLSNQIRSYKNSKETNFVIDGKEYEKTEIISCLEDSLSLLSTTEESIKDDIRELYINEDELDNFELKGILLKHDKALHSDENFQLAPSLFFEDPRYKTSNQMNHTKNLKQSVSKVDKLLKVSSLDPDAKISPYNKKMLKYYHNNRNLPMMDVFVHKDGQIEEIHEIKTISNKTGVVRLPLNLSYETQDSPVMKEIFRLDHKEDFKFRKDNVEFMKQHQAQILDKQTSKEMKISQIGFDTSKLFYVFNIINEIKGVSTLYKVPIDKYHEFYLRDDFLENVDFGKRNSYKFYCDINADFLEEALVDYKISPTVSIKEFNPSLKPGS